MSDYSKIRVDIEAKQREIRELEAKLRYSDGDRVIACMIDQNVMFSNVIINNDDLFALAQWLLKIHAEHMKRKGMNASDRINYEHE